ncbi:MAG TPA: FAD-dependent monooxygenase [Burkholderiaceae bacterium]|nr:FAD-dependent monooxygenase [Burkholderiaceae bacterium]
MRFIVGADGPTSKVARTFDLGVNREFLFGVEAELTGISLPEPERLHCFLDRRLARGYIGWAFDGVDVTQIGLAARQRQAGETVDLDAFLAKLSRILDLASMNVIARRAGLIPVGGPVTPIAGDRVLLVGDAAGLVSPLTAAAFTPRSNRAAQRRLRLPRHLHAIPDPDSLRPLTYRSFEPSGCCAQHSMRFRAIGCSTHS